MRTIAFFIIILEIGCSSPSTNEQLNNNIEKNETTDCKYYQEGLDYFNRNYFDDYMNNGSRDTAINIFEKAVKAGCQEFDLFYKLYFCCEWEGDYINADKYITLAIKADTSKNKLYYWRGELNMRLGELEEAYQDFQKYVSFSDTKNLKNGYYRCGAVLYAMGDTVNSNKFMRKAVELNEGVKMRDFHSFGKSWGMIK